MDVYAQYEFQVRSYECGPDGAATLPTVCNYLQEAASLHAEKLGFSKSDFAAEGANISWVPARVYELANDVRPRTLGEDAFSKLRWTCRETAGEMPFRARRGDIDLNGHVNNVHYVEWLVEALPADVGPVGDFEIAFKSETLAGEEVRSAAVEVEPGVWAAHVAAPDGRDHVVAQFSVRPE